VQHGEDDVDLAQGLGDRSGLAVDHFAVGRVEGEHHAALARLGELLDVRLLPVDDGHPFRLVGGECPTAVPGDADRQDVVLRTVDGAQHRARRDHGDPVFGAAAAEDDGHTRLARRLLRALGEVLGAHIALRVPVGTAVSQRPTGAVAQRRTSGRTALNPGVVPAVAGH
jgi:hypothetical protein